MGKYMKKKTKASWKRRTLSGLCVVLALILTVMVAVTVYYESLLGKINRPGNTGTLTLEELEQLLQEDIAEATGTGPEVDDDEVHISGADQIVTGQDTINIMLVGQDARPGEKRARSDTMILCTIRKSDGSVTLTSFLRDTYVKIPGVRKGKMNTAYAYGGMELLADTMLENFGIQIDNTVEVSFTGFMDVIDTIGGVEVELTAEEAAFLNRDGNSGVTNNTDWNLKEGKNLLDGAQALGYARIRKLDNDFGRSERQRKVLAAVVEQVRDLNLAQLNGLVNQLVGLITTDMTNAEITGYVLELFPLLADLKINTQRIPIDKSYYYSKIEGAGDCVVIDFDANLAFLKETLGD